jgi:hypothetical protein
MLVMLVLRKEDGVSESRVVFIERDEQLVRRSSTAAARWMAATT